MIWNCDGVARRGCREERTLCCRLMFRVWCFGDGKGCDVVWCFVCWVCVVFFGWLWRHFSRILPYTQTHKSFTCVENVSYSIIPVVFENDMWHECVKERVNDGINDGIPGKCKVTIVRDKVRSYLLSICKYMVVYRTNMVMYRTYIRMYQVRRICRRYLLTVGGTDRHNNIENTEGGTSRKPESEELMVMLFF